MPRNMPRHSICADNRRYPILLFKVLIIEDEVSIAELERDYLEISGFEVDISTNGKEGLERALSEDYELLLLDLMLPGMDGYEICKQVRVVKEIPIIMVSAKKNDIDKIRGLSDMEVTVVSLSSSPRHPERSCSHPGTLAA